MELYDNQGSRTPSPPKKKKPSPLGQSKKRRPLEFTQKRSFLFCFICRKADGLFPL